MANETFTILRTPKALINSMTNTIAATKIKSTPFYTLFRWLIDLERVDLYNNVWGLSIAAFKEALQSKKLYYLKTGLPITGNEYGEAYAVLFMQYQHITGAPEMWPLLEKMNDIGAAKLEICTTGNYIEVCLTLGQSDRQTLSKIDWQSLYYTGIAYFKDHGFEIKERDPLAPAFLAQVLDLCNSKHHLIELYRRRITEFQAITDTVQPNNIRVIDSALNAVNMHFGTQHDESLLLDDMIDLVSQMRDNTATLS